MNSSLHSDSQSAINLTNNSAYHNKTKHIDVQYHFIRIFLKNCVITGEDTHKSESRRHVDQDGNDGEVEDLLSLRESSRVKIQS